MNNLGNQFYKIGELNKSMEYYESAIENSIKIGDDRSLSLLLTNTGSLHASLGDLDKCLEFYNKSYELKKKFGDKWGISTVLENIGTILFEKGEFDQALDYYDRSIKIRREIGDKAGVALSLNNIGELHHYSDDYEKAVEYLHQALEICKELDELWLWSVINYRIADSYVSLGELHRSYSYANEALKASISSGAKSDQARSLAVLGKAWLALGDMEKCLIEFEKAKLLLEETKEMGELAKLYYEFSRYYNVKGENDNEIEYLKKAMDIFKPAGLNLWIEKCEKALKGACCN